MLQFTFCSFIIFFFFKSLIFIVKILLKAFDSLFNGQFQCDDHAPLLNVSVKVCVYSETDFQQ